MTPAPPRAFALLGPTASGKTALALHLARHFPCEIISLDSALVYRGMDIGTAKPTPAERAAVPHHLIDIIDPLQHYSAADFVSDCLRLADDIGKRGRIPLIVGGTMMYFQSLTQGLNNLPSADAAVRAELHALKQQHGLPFLYNQLQEIDPDTAARLAPADSQRIERALEVWRLTGKPLSRHLAEQPAAPALALHTLALVPDHRAELHRRIAERFDAMLAQGLTDEVAELRARYPELHQELPSMRCTGYRQTWDFLDGRITYPQLREHGIAATRQLAKRQLTWLRRLPADTVLDPCALPAADLECAARDALARFQAA